MKPIKSIHIILSFLIPITFNKMITLSDSLYSTCTEYDIDSILSIIGLIGIITLQTYGAYVLLDRGE